MFATSLIGLIIIRHEKANKLSLLIAVLIYEVSNQSVISCENRRKCAIRIK